MVRHFLAEEVDAAVDGPQLAVGHEDRLRALLGWLLESSR